MSIDVFSDTLVKLLSDPEKIVRYGKRSMELSEKFSIETQVSSLENLYFEAILQNWRGSFVSRISARLKF
jgi:glycosyltransferase involved in cell wall biosynthesis